MSHSPSPPALYPHSSFPSFLLCYQSFLQGKDPWNFVWLVWDCLCQGRLCCSLWNHTASPSRRNCLFMCWNQPWHWALPHCMGFSCGWYRKYYILLCPALCSSFFSKFFFSLPLLWRDFCGKRKWNRWLQQVTVLWAAGPSENWGCLSLCWVLWGDWGRWLARIHPGPENRVLLLAAVSHFSPWLFQGTFLSLFYQVRVGAEEPCSQAFPTPSCCSCVSDGQHHIGFSGLLWKHESYHQHHDPVKSLGQTFTRVTSVTALWGSRVMSWPWKNLCCSWSCRFIWDTWSPSLLLPGHFFAT